MMEQQHTHTESQAKASCGLSICPRIGRSSCPLVYDRRKKAHPTHRGIPSMGIT
jgi:hypothetical protein